VGALIQHLAAAGAAAAPHSCARHPGKTCWPWKLEHRRGSAAMKLIQPDCRGVASSEMFLVADLWVDLCVVVALVLLSILSSVVLPKAMHHH